MTVTSVRLRLFSGDARKVRAVGSIILDGCFQIEHIHVVEKEDGSLIVAMPSKYEAGRYHDMAHPITKSARESINRAILDEYARATSRQGLTIPARSVKVSP